MYARPHLPQGAPTSPALANLCLYRADCRLKDSRIRRRDFDLLKATLTNCARHGAASQNREEHADFRAHLNGRIAFVEMLNPDKGRRLRDIFEKIEWEKTA